MNFLFWKTSVCLNVFPTIFHRAFSTLFDKGSVFVSLYSLLFVQFLRQWFQAFSEGSDVKSGLTERNNPAFPNTKQTMWRVQALLIPRNNYITWMGNCTAPNWQTTHLIPCRYLVCRLAFILRQKVHASGKMFFCFRPVHVVVSTPMICRKYSIVTRGLLLTYSWDRISSCLFKKWFLSRGVQWFLQ